jgi:hypothetical protein
MIEGRSRIIFLLPYQRRVILGRTRKGTRRKLRQRLATQEWISRVRWYNREHRHGTAADVHLVAVAFALAVSVVCAGLWAVLS